jgi:hypothetical protein
MHFGKLGHYFFEMPTYILCFYKATWNNIKQVVHVFINVGWVSKKIGICWIHFSQNNLQKILVSLSFMF